MSYFDGCILTGMMTTLSTKGQTVIPESIREQARLKTADKLDVGYINGPVVMRKRVPLTPSQGRALSFDTNVVASVSFWRGKPFDCLAAWAQGRCRAFVSPQFLAEYGDTIEELGEA